MDLLAFERSISLTNEAPPPASAKPLSCQWPFPSNITPYLGGDGKADSHLILLMSKLRFPEERDSGHHRAGPVGKLPRVQTGCGSSSLQDIRLPVSTGSLGVQEESLFTL